MSALIFIDTNIYLDFYRVRGTDARLSILERFDQNHDRIITTTEVEMEYKKNRQKVIVDCLIDIKSQSQNSLVIPAFLRETRRDETIRRTQQKLSEQTQKLRERTAKLLESPGLNDPVYRTLQRLFKAGGGCHLNRNDKIRFDIRKLAEKRFMLGYPPRKPSDTSMIDAINWEWIIHCAQNCSDNIIIVSRDSDYGIHNDGISIINDWLLQEFKERVSHRRSLSLTVRLTEAFKQASITVSKEEEESEDSLLKNRDIRSELSRFPAFDPTWPDDVKHKWFDKFDEILKKFTPPDTKNTFEH